MPGWMLPGQQSDASAWAFDADTGWSKPGEARPTGGLQYDMPPGFAGPPQGQGNSHLVVSPPGTPAPRHAIDYTPATRQTHGIGAQAPVDQTNLSLIPTMPETGGGAGDAATTGGAAPGTTPEPAPSVPPPVSHEQGIMQLLQAIAP